MKRKSVSHKWLDINTSLANHILQKENTGSFTIYPDTFKNNYKDLGFETFSDSIDALFSYILEKKNKVVDCKKVCKKFGIVSKETNFDYNSFVKRLTTAKNFKYYSSEEILKQVKSVSNESKFLFEVLSSFINETFNVETGKELLSELIDVDSKAFHKYSQIILKNIVNFDTGTNNHHILPFSIQNYINTFLEKAPLSEDIFDKPSNLVKLSVEDHKLAHLCLFQSLNFDNIERMYSQETNAAKKQAIRGLCLSIIHACSSFKRYFESELSKKKEKRNPNISLLVENFRFPSFLNPDNKPGLAMFLGFLTHKMPGTNKIIVDSDNNVLSRKDIVAYISNLYVKQNPGLSEQSYKMFSMTLRQIIQYHEGYLEYPFTDEKYRVMNVNLPNNKKIAINCNNVNIFSKRADGYKLFCMETGNFVKNLLGEDLIFENPDAIANYTDNTYIDIRACLGVKTTSAPNKYYLIQDNENKHYFLYKNLPDRNSQYYNSCVEFNKLVEEKNLFNKELYRYLHTFSKTVDKSSFSDIEKKYLYVCKKQQYKEELFTKHQSSAPEKYVDIESMFPDSSIVYEILNIGNLDTTKNPATIAPVKQKMKETLDNPFSNNKFQLSSKKDITYFCPEYDASHKACAHHFTFPNIIIDKSKQTIQFSDKMQFYGLLLTAKMKEKPEHIPILREYLRGEKNNR